MKKLSSFGSHIFFVLLEFLVITIVLIIFVVKYDKLGFKLTLAGIIGLTIYGSFIFYKMKKIIAITKIDDKYHLQTIGQSLNIFKSKKYIVKDFSVKKYAILPFYIVQIFFNGKSKTFLTYNLKDEE